jgi:hypothetical protein
MSEYFSVHFSPLSDRSLVGIWVNAWNSWNNNWVISFPWLSEDSKIAFHFDLELNNDTLEHRKTAK